jgi:hypothetical protein
MTNVYNHAIDLDRTHQLQLNNYQFELLVILITEYGWADLNQLPANQLIKLLMASDLAQEPKGEQSDF